MRFLAIAGSLRAVSSNKALLGAAARLAPPGVEVVIHDAWTALPAFNPDNEPTPPPVVCAWQQALADADAVVVSSPEYAHGVVGALKNALDWVVGSGELVDKPVALLNAAPRSTIAHAALTGTLTVMSARVVADASLAFPLTGRKLDADGIAADPELSALLHRALAALVAAVNERRASSS